MSLTQLPDAFKPLRKIEGNCYIIYNISLLYLYSSCFTVDHLWSYHAGDLDCQAFCIWPSYFRLTGFVSFHNLNSHHTEKCGANSN